MQIRFCKLMDHLRGWPPYLCMRMERKMMKCLFSHCLGLLYLCPQMHRTFKGYAIMTMVVVIETVSGDPIRSKSVSKDPPRW
jgi:hypothetical protein